MEIIWKTIQLSCLFFSFAEFFVQDKRFFSERLWGESGWKLRFGNYVKAMGRKKPCKILTRRLKTEFMAYSDQTGQGRAR